MNNNDILEQINHSIKRSTIPNSAFLPNVYRFNDENMYNECINLLGDNYFNLIDVNKYLTIVDEDYSIRLNELGYKAPDNMTINDILEDDNVKNRLIYKAKFNRLCDKADNNMILCIRYNEFIINNINNNFIYETLRSWLKDGYLSHGHRRRDILVNAIIFAETTDGLRDFAQYAVKID